MVAADTTTAMSQSSDDDVTWDENFAAFRDYCNTKNGGSLIIPVKENWDEYGRGNNLYNWATVQRQHYHNGLKMKKPCLSWTRIEKLKAIGFDFTLRQHKSWDGQFDALLEHRTKNGGSINVSKSTDRNLFNWIKAQRQQYQNRINGKKPCLSKERIDKLEKIGFVFCPNDWDEHFAAFRDYCNTKNGGSQIIPEKENWDKLSGGKNLYKWVCTQRQLYRNGQNGKNPCLSMEHLEKLELVGFNFNPRKGRPPKQAGSSFKLPVKVSWDDYLDALLQYKDKNGGSLVVLKRTNWDQYEGKNLYNWASAQRQQYQNWLKGKKPSLSKERIEKLNGIGFVFCPQQSKPNKRLSSKNDFSEVKGSWDEHFAALLEYRDNNRGTLTVQNRGNWDEYRGLDLYNWTSRQRKLYQNAQNRKEPVLSKDHIEKLELVGFNFCPGPRDKANSAMGPFFTWEENYKMIMDMQHHYEQTLKEIQAVHPRLKRWMDEQRMRYHNGQAGVVPALKAECITKLFQIGFDFGPVPDSSNEVTTATFVRDQQGGDDEVGVLEYENLERSFLTILDHEVLEAEEETLIEKLDAEIQQSEEYQNWIDNNTCVEQVSCNVADNSSWSTIGVGYKGVWAQCMEDAVSPGLVSSSVQRVNKRKHPENGVEEGGHASLDFSLYDAGF